MYYRWAGLGLLTAGNTSSTLACTTSVSGWTGVGVGGVALTAVWYFPEPGRRNDTLHMFAPSRWGSGE